MPLHVSSICAYHQEVKITLHSLWYHQTYRWLAVSCTSISQQWKNTVPSNRLHLPDGIGYLYRTAIHNAIEAQRNPRIEDIHAHTIEKTD